MYNSEMEKNSEVGWLDLLCGQHMNIGTNTPHTHTHTFKKKKQQSESLNMESVKLFYFGRAEVSISFLLKLCTYYILEPRLKIRLKLNYKVVPFVIFSC